MSSSTSSSNTTISSSIDDIEPWTDVLWPHLLADKERQHECAMELVRMIAEQQDELQCFVEGLQDMDPRQVTMGRILEINSFITQCDREVVKLSSLLTSSIRQQAHPDEPGEPDRDPHLDLIRAQPSLDLGQGNKRMMSIKRDSDSEERYKEEKASMNGVVREMEATIQRLEGEHLHLTDLLASSRYSDDKCEIESERGSRFLIVDIHGTFKVAASLEQTIQQLLDEWKTLQNGIRTAEQRNTDLQETLDNVQKDLRAEFEELQKTRDLIAYLGAVFEDVSLYRRLLDCRESVAQTLIDTFQVLLDSPGLIPSFKRNLLVATQRLSRSTGTYPTCYNLEGIELIDDDPVAAGGFADIYKGRYMGQVVCLKVIRIYQKSHIQSFLKHLSAEAILWGQLSHQNILPVYGLCRLKGGPCLVAPWMVNGDLRQYLEENPDVTRVLLVSDISSGIFHLHRQGIVHGDLKGANILIDTCGRALIGDFGLSSVSDSQILHWTGYSSAMSRGGSVRWQAPELLDSQNDDMVNNTKASDVYAFACVAYEIYTNRLPFFEITRDVTLIAKIQAGERPSRPKSSSQAWNDWGLSEDIWRLLQSFWSREPSIRPDINEAVEYFRSTITVDDRPLQTAASLLTSRSFRDSMGTKPDLPSPLDLEAMIATDSPEI